MYLEVCLLTVDPSHDGSWYSQHQLVGQKQKNMYMCGRNKNSELELKK